uniref:NADH-ubiquinone oxidoreductase chain 6 n=1 Tax=Pityophthorus pubescens TaxID=471227 RepID=A0A343A6I1_9CUCU|nr:NADH dehydrogenase subunit 6 [Pityophthorus pubescens]AOY40160.1 NADH dehydrogenase subunit 6 [Pityophthorus pubescens]
MLYMMMLNWVMSTILIFLKHPLSMGGVLLIQTIIIAMMSGMLYTNFWLSYILFLIMVGGMLIMFMYMTSIASNEKFMIPKLTMILFMFSMMLSMITAYFIDTSLLTPLMKINMSSQLETTKMFKLSIMKFFNHPNFMFSIMLMMYLLLTLIAVVKITDKKMGPLRQK